jgi:hypothetical protein
MSNSPGALEQLSVRIDDLEKRVHALEHPEEARLSRMESPPAGDAAGASQIPAAALQTGNLLPVLGRAMLGIAGAYLLRAVTTAGQAPVLLVSAVAVIYAFGWLVWSLRTPQILHRYAYAATSALILAPMLWESTLHFNFLTPMMAAGVLAGFVTLATALELRDANARTAWIAQVTAVMLAAALAFATRHVLPFLITLLIAVSVLEFARVRGYAEKAWLLIALVTDAAIWGTVFIYTGPESARGDYVQLSPMSLVAPGCLLFLLEGGSVAMHVGLRRSSVGILEAVQLLIAFSLAIASILFFAPLHGQAIVGVTCLVLAVGMYPATYFWFRQSPEPRNFRVFGTWAAGLLVAGAISILPRDVAAMLLAVAGCAAYFIAVRLQSGMLELHGTIFLCTGAGISELPRYVFGALASALPGRPAISVVVISLAAALAFIGDREGTPPSATRKALQFIPALMAACALTALLAHGVLAVFALAHAPEAHHTAFLRTLAVSFVSMCMAFAGSRWGLAALTKLAYVALVFVAAKLMFEDLRHGHMVYIAGSIFLFAVTLIAVPRLVRWGARSERAKSPEMISVGRAK